MRLEGLPGLKQRLQAGKNTWPSIGEGGISGVILGPLVMRHPPTIGWETPMATKDCIGPGSLCYVCSRKNKSAKHPEDVLMEPCALSRGKVCILTKT